MSYARLSEESDVYCYATREGYELHLAGKRHVDHPAAGKSFSYDTLWLLRDALLSFQSVGFRVPASCLERIFHELEDNEFRG